MSQPTAINPFPGLNQDFIDGLDAIIGYINGSTPILKPTIDDLNHELVIYIKSKFSYGSGTLDDVELNSYLPSSINAYINNDIKGSTINQAPFVALLLEKIKEVPPMQIPNFITDVENKIAEACLSLPEQNQLYLATAAAKASFSYWIAQNNNLASTSWAPFLDTNTAVNIANLPYWVTAAIQAALYFCFKGNYQTLSSDPPKISGPEYVNVLTASLGIAAGKVLFNWIPKPIMPKLSLNKEVIANLNEEDIPAMLEAGGGLLSLWQTIVHTGNWQHCIRRVHFSKVGTAPTVLTVTGCV